jgi:hypothetical protein
MSVKRDWNVPIDLPERVQEYGANGQIDPVDRGEAQQAFIDAETHLRDLGGGLIVQAVRVPFAEGRYVTVGYQFRHDSFVPAVQASEPEANGGIVEDADEALTAEPVT